jgi:DNA-binding transcriptional ArsR family regulator
MYRIGLPFAEDVYNKNELEFLEAIASKPRIDILMVLATVEEAFPNDYLFSSSLMRILELKSTAIGRHTKILTEAGLIEEKTEGQHRAYGLTEDGRRTVYDVLKIDKETVKKFAEEIKK